MAEIHSHSLQELMQRVGFSSFRALSQASGVSEKQIRRLRQGKITQMRLETLDKLSRALQVSVMDLWPIVLSTPHASTDKEQVETVQERELANLRQEYERLQEKLTQQRQALWQEFQHSTLQVLEPLLLQLPTAAYAAQSNPAAPAIKLLPLLKPIDRLLEEWGIEAIAPVGAELPYDPQFHQLMEGTALPGEMVRVRYTGYRSGDRLLYRAKVSLLNRNS